MEKLTDLFKIIELTRSQPQYGYATAGIKQDDLSNLAEHHYLVAFIAWQLALYVNSKGSKIDVQKVLEYSLVHDLGELLGGDIAMPYAKANPKARELAKAFEAENQKYLSKFFGSQQSYYQSLSDEIMDAKTDEAIISKVADYIEVMNFKEYLKVFSEADAELARTKLLGIIEKINDQTAKKELLEFIKQWLEASGKNNISGILFSGETQ